MPVERATAAELDALSALIDGWAAEALASNALLAAVDRDPGMLRWYVRMRGEDKAIITVWLTLRERTLHFETYFMPGPEEQRDRCFEYLLRANQAMLAWRFTLGAEEAVYLVGALPVTSIDADELDRIIGSAYAYSEQHFCSAMSIGYATRFPAAGPS
ncbi:MAG: YbjN domain-containing protein [Actinomycetota bacterium]|nr:YbjN domain-containing protein [Actinomycetota bacterium]